MGKGQGLAHKEQPGGDALVQALNCRQVDHPGQGQQCPGGDQPPPVGCLGKIAGKETDGAQSQQPGQNVLEPGLGRVERAQIVEQQSQPAQHKGPGPGKAADAVVFASILR